MANAEPIEGRSCGDCSLCCKVMSIGELEANEDMQRDIEAVMSKEGKGGN